MTRLPALSAKQLNHVLLTLGFRVTRQRGSHVFYRHSDGRTTTVPHHAGRDIARPLLHEILREIDLSLEELIRLLE